jgi:hypothetical protein
MQFIGIGFKSLDVVDLELIRGKAADYDLLASKNMSEGGFREGLVDFSSHFDLSLLQFAAFNEDDKKASSRQISDELMSFHRDSKENSFLNFLTAEKASFPQTFYLFFACDWNQADPTRLEKITIDELKPYFKRNNSWYLWLYNYSAKRYYPKLDLPLVLEITNRG